MLAAHGARFLNRSVRMKKHMPSFRSKGPTSSCEENLLPTLGAIK
jgi:hypothetical protein